MDKQLTILLPNDVPLEMILVEPGCFIMGDEKSYHFTGETHEHLVHITHPFYIGKYLVTQAQWEAVKENNPSHFSGLQRPVERVSWQDIVEKKQDEDGTPAFLTLMNSHLSKERPDLAATQQFLLPTEAEWEYAAKGGPRYLREELEDKKTAECYSEYAGGDRLKSCGWFNGNSNSETKPVGLKQANALGLYDMSGDVYEWCRDWFDDDSYKDRKGVFTKDPTGPDNGTARVVRGGYSWNSAGGCRSTYRYRNAPYSRESNVGFRLVLSRSLGSGTSGEPAGRQGRGIG